MQLPEKLIQSLAGIKGFDKNAFEAVHAGGEQVTSVRFNPAKTNTADKQAILQCQWPGDHSLSIARVPWSSNGYYLAERPSFIFDPLLHAGVYYVQEASSMFLEQVMRQTVDLTQRLRILDLCAAPGGKSTLLQSLITHDSLLVSNEVIKSRAAVLEENITKWGTENIVVTNNDPAHFARLENYFDVIVIDAPCSGSGLFRRDPAAIAEWSENNVQLCSQRQQRIIADVWPALKKDGILVYSTCSYSKQEDEDILDWIKAQCHANSIRLATDTQWNIIETAGDGHDAYGYRFYPDKIKGEGFFIAAIQKTGGDAFTDARPARNKTDTLSRAEAELVQPWLKKETDLVLFRQQDHILALPASLQQDMAVLQSATYIKKAGTTVGKLAGRDMIPAHALAVSNCINTDLPAMALNRQQAIQYLRREDISLQTAHRGWLLATYLDHNLGWIKVLPNRFNNYYPKEWRILKEPV